MTHQRRILAVWLPRFSTYRLKRKDASLSEGPPLVVAGRANNALYVQALDVRAQRLGLYKGQIDGLARKDGDAVMKGRGNGYRDFADFVRRTALGRRALVILAEADAFRGFGLDRREGLWAVRRLPDDKPLPVMPLSEHVLADYRTVALSLKAYPTQFLRPRFDAEGFTACADVGKQKDGAFVRCAGVVLVRQRPGEGKTIFITLSDETGVCNVVIWERLFENFRKEVMGARLLLAESRMQKSPEGVVI